MEAMHSDSRASSELSSSKKARNRRRCGVRSESVRDGQFAIRVGAERLEEWGEPAAPD